MLAPWQGRRTGKNPGLCSRASSHISDSGFGYGMTAPEPCGGCLRGVLGWNRIIPRASQSLAPLRDGVRKSQGTFLSLLCARVPKIPSAHPLVRYPGFGTPELPPHLRTGPHGHNPRNKTKPQPQKQNKSTTPEIKQNKSTTHQSTSRGFLQAPTRPAGSLWDLSLSEHHLLHKSHPSLSALRRKGRRCREGRAQL